MTFEYELLHFKAKLPLGVRSELAEIGRRADACRIRAEQAEARLAAIEKAPVVAWQDVHDPSDLYWRRPDPAQVDTRELIARPAKD
jgi:hypothetical protein